MLGAIKELKDILSRLTEAIEKIAGNKETVIRLAEEEGYKGKLIIKDYEVLFLVKKVKKQ